MKRKMYLKLYYLLAIILTMHIVSVSGQQNNSLSFFDRVPQTTQLNPAIQPACALYIGIPAISSFEINAGTNALGIGDILIKHGDSLVTPLYSKEITTLTIDKLRKSNIIYSGFQVDLISFGFKIKDSYVSFLISDKMNISVNIPKELASFVYEGIDVGKTFEFDNIGINSTYYREYSIGYSQKISDKIYFGVRGKMLFGKANISGGVSNITISEPNWRTIDMSSSVKMNASIPQMEVYSDATGSPDSIKFGDFSSTSEILNDMVFLNKNRGYGFDLGFQYFASDKLTISASILDLGFISWKTNVQNLNGGGDYSFKGMDLNQDDSTNFAEALLDTLMKINDVTASSDPYSTLLTPRLYVGVSYAPVKFLKLGLLSRSEYVLKTFRQQITGSVTLYPSQFLGTTLSYTIADRLYDNLGIGLVFRTGPFQMYLMSERIPLFWNKVKSDGIPYLPVYTKNVNFRMGFNLVFGANPRRKLLKDQPFLE